MQDKEGGYCPMCDTVWASPGKCSCEAMEINVPFKESDIAHIYKEGWNAAIEAAAKDVEDRASNQPDDFYVIDCNEHANNIRKLKK